MPCARMNQRRNWRRLAASVLLGLIFAVPGAFADVLQQAEAAYVAGDYETAYALLLPLAEDGQADAQITLGIMHEYGRGVPRDTAVAARWYARAAAQGDPIVQHDLASKYFRGNSIARDYTEAARWWRAAAESGLAASQYDLGLMYYRGVGGTQSYSEAATWYRKAAAQGHARAQYALGIMYALGQGVESDPAEAVRLFQASADQDFAPAQYNLGLMLESGRGVEADAGQARVWFQLAADQGLEEAIAKLEGPGAASARDDRLAVAPAVALPQSAAPAAVQAGDMSARLSNLDATHYTVQLVSLGSAESVSRFLSSLEPSDIERGYLRYDSGGEARYAALYGVFANSADAGRARDALPGTLKDLGPWVRRIGDLQALTNDAP